MSDTELKRLGERVAAKVASEFAASGHTVADVNNNEYGLAHENDNEEGYPKSSYLDRSEDAINKRQRGGDHN